MVVCSTSRVKPKGSPFELLSFFISSHTAAGEFSPSLVLRLHGEWTGLGQWRKSTTEGYGERLSGLHLLPAFSAFPFDLENRKPYVGRNKGQFCDGLMACLDSVGAIKVQGPQHRMMGSC